MNVILTTCKGRSKYLEPALKSWRFMLPGWTPALVAVDDPKAVALLATTYFGEPSLLTELSQPGFSRLLALKAAVEAFPSEVERVILFDADVIALLHTGKWLSDLPPRSFRIVANGPCRDDFGVLLTTAEVLREAFAVLGDVSDWTGYGWEDNLLRAACWAVTGGRVETRPAAWAHIPNPNDIRLENSATRESVAAQAGANYLRLQRDVRRLAERMGRADWSGTSLYHDCMPWVRENAAVSA